MEKALSQEKALEAQAAAVGGLWLRRLLWGILFNKVVIFLLCCLVLILICSLVFPLIILYFLFIGLTTRSAVKTPSSARCSLRSSADVSS